MKRYQLWYIILFCYFVSFTPAASQNWSTLRNHEAILFTGEAIPQFISAPISHIFVCAYNEHDNSWRELTIQIDELDGDAGYFGTQYNQTLDSIDELLFMAGEAGDYAPPSSWLDEQDSRQYVRYQLELINPDDPLNKKYVYVFRSSTFVHDPSLPYHYINYVPASSGASDTVKAAAYLEGHNSKGVPDVWKIADSTGAYGADILDRQKARVNGKYKYSFLTFDYKMSENDLNVDKLQYKSGPIRIIRDISYKAKVSVLEVNVGTFKYFFYPYSIVALGTNRTLDTDYGVKLIRQSFDLNENAIGMLFNNPYNSAFVIDGQPDIVTTTVQQSPVMNWYSCSGNPGTAVMLYEFTTPENATESLYYQESLSGDTFDGTDDTGDKKSYGDAGIMFKGNKIKGRFSLPYFAYFLPGKRTQDIGATLANQTQNPVNQHTTSNFYIPPTQVALALPDTSAPANNSISIPIFVGDVNGLDITSTQFAVQFDTLVLQANGVSVMNSLVENWNPPEVTIKHDTIFVNADGTTALQDSGALIYLDFTAIGTEGQQSPLHIAQAKFNIWNPLALPNDGIFTTLAPLEVAVTIPNSEGLSGSEVIVPIKIADVTEFSIITCSIELKFGKTILDALSISVDGTIASDWTNINYTEGADWLKIEMIGDNPLTGSGDLVKIKFKVIGNSGQSTNISFEKMIFNEGVPQAKTNNGIFTVTTPLQIDDLVTIPDTTVKSESVLHIPVRLFTMLDFALTSYDMDLTFDHTILEFIGVDTNGTIPVGWSEPSVNYAPGNLSISSAGTKNLNRSGALIYLDFNVIGPDTSGTDIHFSKMVFNSGKYLPITRDGAINVLGVVPVELSFLTATVLNRDVKIEWSTATESNNFGFYVQRSTDLAADWQTMGFVKGNGTTAIPQKYIFIDKDVPPGLVYYRLQQQDFDGQVNYSEFVEVNLLPNKFALYQNYPNPFNSSTTIKYELPIGEHHVRLTIYDLLGQQVRSLVDEDNQQAGAYQITWDGRDDAGNAAASGVYFYQLQAGRKLFLKKLVLVQ